MDKSVTVALIRIPTYGIKLKVGDVWDIKSSGREDSRSSI